MATKQVITVTLDGKLQGLDHKSKGLDLRQFGKAEIKRATLIEWDEDTQMWFIYWAETPLGLPWRESTFQSVGIDPADQAGFLLPLRDEPLAVGFMDYEDAVEAEIAVIQAMQLNGVAR